jgi:hypothetical protein
MLNLFGHPQGTLQDAIFFRRVINLGVGAGAAGGGLESAQNLTAILRVDPAGASPPVAVAPELPTRQPLPVDAAALPDFWWDSAEPFATRFTRDSQPLKHAAPSPSSDVIMPALPFSEEIEV